MAEVRAEAGYRLFVRFVDDTSGWVDLSRLVVSAEAGVFADLHETAKFAEVGIEMGAVTWPGGIDLAPDAMYAAIRDNGLWVLE